MLNIVLANIFILFGSLAVMCFTDPFILIILVPMSVLYYRLQKFYRASSRVLRRLGQFIN
jgi:ATP-binding cassette subfamily C (CFTR/MRP) protein 10